MYINILKDINIYTVVEKLIYNYMNTSIIEKIILFLLFEAFCHFL